MEVFLLDLIESSEIMKRNQKAEKLFKKEDFGFLIEKDEFFMTEIPSLIEQLLDHTTKQDIMKFQLEYLKSTNDFLKNSDKYDWELSENLIKWLKEDFLSYFNKLNHGINVKDPNELSKLLLIFKMSAKIFALSEKHEDTSYIYESLYLLKSRIKEKGYLKGNPIFYGKLSMNDENIETDVQVTIKGLKEGCNNFNAITTDVYFDTKKSQYINFKEFLKDTLDSNKALIKGYDNYGREELQSTELDIE